MIIDAFVHCGRKKFLPVAALEDSMAAAGIDGCLLVQHMGEFDNSYLASIVQRAPDRFQAIALVDTRRKDAPRHLDALLSGQAHSMALAGVRMTPAMIGQSRECLHVLDMRKATLVLHLPNGLGCHLDLVVRIVEEFPHVTVYVPHLGWPVAGREASRGWHTAVRTLGDHRQVVFGLSCIGDFSQTRFPHQDVWPYLRHVVATVGAERTVWASDYPLIHSIGDYLGLFTGTALDVDVDQRNAILSGTALRCWGFTSQEHCGRRIEPHASLDQ